MQNKALRRNVIPSTALTAGTTTSQIETNTWGRGIRFYVTISAVTAGGGTDKLFLCGQAPAGGSLLPLAGFSAANMLASAGTFVFDFYPGAWMPGSGIATGGALVGAMGVELPLNWGVQLVLGAGNAATIAVDAEILP